MSKGVVIIEPPAVGHWQCVASPMLGVPPTSTPSLSLADRDAEHCPACGHKLADGVVEVSTGITERRKLRKTGFGWRMEYVDPECFGETWYECAACGMRLPEVIGQRIAAEL